jgi:putative inorganic carbon (hco3(-)) transporter
MSLTALFWISSYCAAILLSLAMNPLFGALGYLLEYYMRPELKWWGDDLPGFRWNLIIAIVLGVTFFLRRSSLRDMKPAINPSLRWLLALGALQLVVTLTVPVDFTYSWAWMVQWYKVALIFPLLLVGVVRSRGGFNAFVVLHMLGAFTWGWDAWQDPSRVAGRLVNIGSGDSLNDNEASAHLLTVLPFAIIYLLTEKDWRLRGAALISAPFIVNTLILCNSRGAMVGVGAAMAAAFFLVRSGRRMRMVGAGALTLAVGLYLADPQFIQRQQTTSNYEEDNSAQERLMTWTGGARLILDRPFGAGGRGFHLLSHIYIPLVVEAHGGDPRAPHNTYVMVAAEWGVLGLILYLGCYGSAFMLLRRVKQSCTPEDGFFYWRAFAIQLAIVAYMVTSAFTDRLYGEAGYWMISLAYALYRIQVTEFAARTVPVVTAAAPAPAPGAPVAWPLAGANLH